LKVVVVYDISDDGVRLRVSRLLEVYGLSRIQRSAFVGDMMRARALDLARRLETIIDHETDVVHIVFVQPQDWSKTIVIGKPLWVRGVIDAIHLL
jgi:CRISPR-associated protein Cas2